MKMFQIHEPRGLQRATSRSFQVTEASGKDLAMTAIKNAFESPAMTGNTLRHIDAAAFLQEEMCDEV
ncbi:hypothetical protein [Pseudomonas nitroreducens]|uniref:hypothetical protein n=1 Tax=Pseudomonas nitroreducens TaxID=46680 RepID=UPI00209E08D2|nr:hypothetical protein [Pseudomonas nitroreducens]MCP1624831.1 hypothetical protein [Pseudomonas nitroreducens]